MKISALFTLALLASASAHATLPGPKTGIGLFLETGTDQYRLGDEWGKKPVTQEELAKAPPSFLRAALATAHVGGATGFYLGKFHGAHVMATNHHVYPNQWSCSGEKITFPIQGVSASCERYLGTWDEIDLTLFTIRLAPQDEAKLAGAAGNFRFREDVFPGEQLLTIGFGIAGNSQRSMMANQDSDCYVFSGKGDYRLMGDPDELNPAEYKAWSFALGCDVSHGDSGSAIVDRDSGAVVGIIWTGRVPKSPAAQTSNGLGKMFREQTDSIWKELSYAVPAKKMGEVLQQAVSKGGMPEESRAILSELLQ